MPGSEQIDRRGIVCPYCLSRDDDPSGVFERVDDITKRVDCGHCEKTFEVNQSVSVLYVSRPVAVLAQHFRDSDGQMWTVREPPIGSECEHEDAGGGCPGPAAYDLVCLEPDSGSTSRCAAHALDYQDWLVIP